MNVTNQTFSPLFPQQLTPRERSQQATAAQQAIVDKINRAIHAGDTAMVTIVDANRTQETRYDIATDAIRDIDERLEQLDSIIESLREGWMEPTDRHHFYAEALHRIELIRQIPLNLYARGGDFFTETAEQLQENIYNSLSEAEEWLGEAVANRSVPQGTWEGIRDTISAERNALRRQLMEIEHAANQRRLGDIHRVEKENPTEELVTIQVINDIMAAEELSLFSRLMLDSEAYEPITARDLHPRLNYLRIHELSN